MTIKRHYTGGRRLNLKQIIVLLLFLGVVAGVLFANLFQTEFLKQLEIMDSGFITGVKSLDIEYISLFQYVLLHKLKAYGLLWIFSITILGIPYIFFFILKQGFCTGFILSVLTLEYGGKGILLFLAYLFPQYIIYIPVFFLVIYRGYYLSYHMYFASKVTMKSKKSLIVEKIPLFFLLLILLLAGCLSETYINSVILKYVLGKL